MEDLEYIVKVLTEKWGSWLPAGTTSIRLDYDGEICFSVCHGQVPTAGEYDFYPSDVQEAEKIFLQIYGPIPALGKEYTIEEYLKTKEQLNANITY